MTLFPFALPGPTATYLVLYLVTLAAHFAFMGYVLAGSGYVAVSALSQRAGGAGGADESIADESIVALILRDWLPFALGTAITAGVAPLLFLQVLYKEHFYTANLLLFYRWLAVVPVLIAGFYLLYLQKSQTAARLPAALRKAVPVAAFLCFVFTAYSWTENHLLSMDRAAWTEMYAAGRHVYLTGQSIPRALFFLALAVPTMCAIVGWQVRFGQGARPGGSDKPDGDSDTARKKTAQRLALLAGLGVIASAATGSGYGYAIGGRAFSAIDDAVGSVTLYYGLIAVGGVVQIAAWAHVWRVGELRARALWATSLGGLATIVGVLAVREALRATAVDIARLSPIHERVAESGGMILFLVFAAAAALVIGWCFQMTARALRSSGQDGKRREGKPEG